MEEKRNCELLLSGCEVVMENHTILPDGAIAVGDKKILDIGPRPALQSRWTPKEMLDCRSKLAMPGMVDGHTHSVQQHLKGGVADEMPIVWRRILVPFESRVDGEARRLASELHCLQMIRNGITTFSDAGTGTGMAELADVVEACGLRANITQPCWDNDPSLPENLRDASPEAALDKMERLYEMCHGRGEGRLQVMFSFSSPDTASERLISLLAEAAQRCGVRLHTHLSQHVDEVRACIMRYGLRPPEYLARCGALHNGLVAAHCIHVTDADLHLMAERGVNIVHCPASNLTTQGLPKVMAESALGLNIALGNDGAAVCRQDLFYQAQLLKIITHACFATPVFETVGLPIGEALDMMTINGARALGLAEITGSLTPGKRADIVLVDLCAVHLQPAKDRLKNLVMAASGQDVSDVLVDGRLLMRERQVLSLNEHDILERARSYHGA